MGLHSTAGTPVTEEQQALLNTTPTGEFSKLDSLTILDHLTSLLQNGYLQTAQNLSVLILNTLLRYEHERAAEKEKEQYGKKLELFLNIKTKTGENILHLLTTIKPVANVTKEEDAVKRLFWMMKYLPKETTVPSEYATRCCIRQGRQTSPLALAWRSGQKMTIQTLTDKIHDQLKNARDQDNDVQWNFLKSQMMDVLQEGSEEAKKADSMDDPRITNFQFLYERLKGPLAERRHNNDNGIFSLFNNQFRNNRSQRHKAADDLVSTVTRIVTKRSTVAAF